MSYGCSPTPDLIAGDGRLLGKRMDDAQLREGCAQQAVTHYGFCSLALANPAFGEASGAFCGRPPRADRQNVE